RLLPTCRPTASLMTKLGPVSGPAVFGRRLPSMVICASTAAGSRAPATARAAAATAPRYITPEPEGPGLVEVEPGVVGNAYSNYRVEVRWIRSEARLHTVGAETDRIRRPALGEYVDDFDARGELASIDHDVRGRNDLDHSHIVRSVELRDRDIDAVGRRRGDADLVRHHPERRLRQNPVHI